MRGCNSIAGGPGTTNTLYWSLDGINWTGLGKTIFSGTCFNIAYNGSIFLATGSGTNTIAYSYNGKDWTGLGTTILATASSIAWNGITWLIASITGTVILTSYNGIQWTNMNAKEKVFV